MRWLDHLHAKYHNDGLYFTDGFGDHDILSVSLLCKEAPKAPAIPHLKKNEKRRIVRFPSPFSNCLPVESATAEALIELPDDWSYESPICIQFAATGDQGFRARSRFVAQPLLEFGIGSIILENPFYGTRKPARQEGTYLRKVSDLWALGLALVGESRALIAWLREQGFRHLGLCGVSMGGALVSQATALCREPLAMCACIAPHCATPVFTQGVLSNYVDWKALGGEEQGRVDLASQLDGSCLDLFPLPDRPDCAIWLAAKRDAYVDPSSSTLAAEYWPGSKLRWLNNGHVGTTMFHRNQYIKEIVSAFNLLKSQIPSPVQWLP